MLLSLLGHDYRYECENLCRLFFPYDPVKCVSENEAEGSAELYALAVIEPKDGKYEYTVAVRKGGKNECVSRLHGELSEYNMTDLMYTVFSEFTGISPAWGMLTGIHPVKLLNQYCAQMGDEAAKDIFCRKYHVTPEKAQLAQRVVRAQRPFTEMLTENDFSLYVSIPFCPTRCSYCSFVSQSIEHAKKLVEPYFELLLKEIEETARITKALGLRLVTVYVGGGTPTTLSARQLSLLCEKIRAEFDMSACTEFSVEAGRPDTIDEEKLYALKNGGVTRISINPQTLSDTVLKNIGRNHSALDVINAFELAKKAGFDNINADLILGLPGDDLKGFKASLRGMIEANASNITVHSLALKRSANIVSEGGDLSLHARSGETAAMMDHSISTLTQFGYEPYYLYRQTRMAGNLENTGWAKPGTVCRYNIYTMDESNTVIACGAGGVSKLRDPYSDRIERIFNFKYPYEYISRNSEILMRKEGVRGLYEQFRQRIH